MKKYIAIASVLMTFNFAPVSLMSQDAPERREPQPDQNRNAKPRDNREGPRREGDRFPSPEHPDGLQERNRPVPPPPPPAGIRAGGGPAFDAINFLSEMGRGSKRTLIVSPSKMDAAGRSTLEEDLNIMSRILDKALERGAGASSSDKYMGIVVSALPGGRNPENIYLEGYGALFLLNVKFPLVAPPSRNEEKKESQGDSTWEETRRELYGRGQPGNAFGFFQDRAPIGFEPGKVEALKKDLLLALKNAANIHQLKGDDTITVAVFGSEGAPMGSMQRSPRRARDGDSDDPKDVNNARAPGPRHAPRQTTLTLRVTKSDVDDFSKGKLDFEEFQKKAMVQSY